jgi:hypothetical protein
MLKPVFLVLALATGLAVWPAPARAATTMGAGNQSCGTWTADRRNPDTTNLLMDISWVAGFLSGIGWSIDGADPLNGIDANAVWGWIDNYCSAHPVEAIKIAAAQFYYAHPHQ